MAAGAGLGRLQAKLKWEMSVYSMKAPSRKSLRLVVVLLMAVVAFQSVPLPARTLLKAGNATVWKYLDGGIEPEAEWNQPSFDDSQWKSGKAPLGYGEPQLGTQVRSGADATHQAITTWFRCEFDLPEIKPGESLVILFSVDDGAVIYLNGQEIGRENMPKGPLSSSTFALRVLGNNDEGFYSRLRVPSNAVRSGQKNLLAVEVHQGAAKSSDLFFDLAIKTLPADSPSCRSHGRCTTGREPVQQAALRGSRREDSGWVHRRWTPHGTRHPGVRHVGPRNPPGGPVPRR